MIEIQAAYINTNHPAFISGTAAASQRAPAPSKPQILPPVRSIYVPEVLSSDKLAQPASTEPLNGRATPAEDVDEDFSDDTNVSNLFPPREGRTPSGSHDRARTTGSVSSITINSTNPHSTNAITGRRSSSKTRQPRTSSHTHHRPPTTGSHTGTNGSPGSARETFLNYFFGQNGPGPIAGSSLERSNALGAFDGGFVPVGRDVSGSEPLLSLGLMAGKRGMDGNSAAFDMKSLGKHIEAVSSTILRLQLCTNSKHNRHLWTVRQ